MPKPPKTLVPAWLKGVTLINPGTLTIDSINRVGKTFKVGSKIGVPFDYKLTYQPSIDRWLQGIYDIPGTTQIDVHFTFKNTSHRVLSGFVGGFIDHTALSQFPVANLAHNGSVSGIVSFHPLNATGDHTITVTFREPLPGPIVPVSMVLATATANYFVY